MVSAELRSPETTWEYAVSASDLLTRHIPVRPVPQPGEEPDRALTVVMLAAAVHEVAVRTGLEGRAVREVDLREVKATLQRYPVSALEACPAPAGTGETERTELLAAYPDGAFTAAVAGAAAALRQHLDDGPNALVTVADRAQAMGRRAFLSPGEFMESED